MLEAGIPVTYLGADPYLLDIEWDAGTRKKLNDPLVVVHVSSESLRYRQN